MHHNNTDIRKLLGCGIKYFCWVPSRKKECCYLFFSKNKSVNLIATKSIIIFFLLIMVIILFVDHDLLSLFVLGCPMLLSGVCAIFLFIKYNLNVVRKIKNPVVLIIDKQKRQLITRSQKTCPFILIKEKREIDFFMIEKIIIEKNFHLKIENNYLYDRASYLPTWTTMFVKLKEEYAEECIPLFIGHPIPLSIIEKVVKETNVSLEENINYKRWE